MSQPSFNQLTEQLALADILLAGRATMHDPQDLPGKYGRVVRAIDHVLELISCEAVVGGGWAVWRHGFINRVTQDIDIILPADRIEEFLKVASVGGFQILPVTSGRWPKVHHKETDIQVDILSEGERPGLPPDFAPTTIPHPVQLGAAGCKLRYLQLAGLIELKIAAGRLKDKADVVELIRANPAQIDVIRQRLSEIHDRYAEEFDTLVEEAQKDDAHQ